jgi:hypothetical protein
MDVYRRSAPSRARGRAGGVALSRDGQSAQADFVCLLRRIHSLGPDFARLLDVCPV